MTKAGTSRGQEVIKKAGPTNNAPSTEEINRRLRKMVSDNKSTLIRKEDLRRTLN